MDLNTIQIEFGKECKCERDVVAQCLKKTMELKNALEVIGVDISKSQRLEYIFTYLVLKLKDYRDEGIEIDKFFQIQNGSETPVFDDDFKLSKEQKEIFEKQHMKYIVGDE